MKRRLPLIGALTLLLFAMLASLLFLTPMGGLVGGLVGWKTGEGEPVRTWVPQQAKSPLMVDVETNSGLSADQVRQIAYDACPQALDEGTCLDYQVQVKPLNGPLGLVEVTWDRPKEGTDTNQVPLKTSGVMLDEGLLKRDPQYVANVAAHEWNHIEQALIAGSLAGRERMKIRARDYYGAKVPGGLPRDDLGLEILADCMATVGDNVPAGKQPGSLPFYLKTYLGTMSARDACGDWEMVLRG